jgi:hypothetical protein
VNPSVNTEQARNLRDIQLKAFQTLLANQFATDEKNRDAPSSYINGKRSCRQVTGDTYAQVAPAVWAIANPRSPLLRWSFAQQRPC